MIDRYQRDYEPLSKDGGDGPIKPQRRIRSVVGNGLGRSNVLQETIGWVYNAVLTGLHFRVRDGIWTAVIKADFGDRAQVAFLDVGTFARCIEVCAEYAEKGQLRWYPDKYPPRTRGRRRSP